MEDDALPTLERLQSEKQQLTSQLRRTRAGRRLLASRGGARTSMSVAGGQGAGMSSSRRGTSATGVGEMSLGESTRGRLVPRPPEGPAPTTGRRRGGGGGDELRGGAARAMKVKKRNEFYKEVRRIAKRLVQQNLSEFEREAHERYRGIRENELERIERVEAMPQQAFLPSRPSRLKQYASHNIQRRVKVDMHRERLTTWNLTNVIPMAQRLLRQITQDINKLKGEPAETFLDLSERHLSSIPLEVTELPQLRRLSLADNYITTLPDQMASLTGLESLLLYQNQIRVLPPVVGEMTSLMFLDLAENSIRMLPESFERLIFLQVLNVSDNALPEFPMQLCNCNGLEQLLLARNEIRVLTGSALNSLQLLVMLDLCDNRLSSLPDEIGKLDALQALLLDGNRLARLPSSLGNLRCLHRLSVARNRLVALPGSLGNLHKLTRFDCSENLLTSLPPQLGRWASIEAMYIDHNLWLTMPISIYELNESRGSISLDHNTRYSLGDWLTEFCDEPVGGSSPKGRAIRMRLRRQLSMRRIVSVVRLLQRTRRQAHALRAPPSSPDLTEGAHASAHGPAAGANPSAMDILNVHLYREETQERIRDVLRRSKSGEWSAVRLAAALDEVAGPPVSFRDRQHETLLVR